MAEKPWGQLGVPHLGDSHAGDRRIGEVSFEHPHGLSLPVLVKYLYTSERLSIQVHPDDQQARAFGHECGKDEMWIVLAAEPGATIGLGLKQSYEPDVVAAAIADGAIVDLVDWRPVRRGEVIYNRAGTIHAAGAGLVLLEVQQSIDLTYRLFDYGRPRELHLAEGLAVSRFEPHHDPRDCQLGKGESRVLADGPHFGAAWCAGGLPEGLPVNPDHWQLVVVSGTASIGGLSLSEGEAAYTQSLVGLTMARDAVVMLAWPAQKSMAEAA
ncbi:class I mannose-6-phosphate isomerase [Sphingomonas humi]|uniref:Class I mannose-6-phosphate isomerase n=1 Tax=Sphingomonas humi TaxID=335630 RepID=A0ABP7S2T7_9SPHN